MPRHPWLETARSKLSRDYGLISDQEWTAILATVCGELPYDFADNETRKEFLTDVGMLLVYRAKLSEASEPSIGRRKAKARGPRGTYRKPRRERISIMLEVNALKAMADFYGYSPHGKIFWKTVAADHSRRAGKRIEPQALRRRYYRALKEQQDYVPGDSFRDMLEGWVQRELDKASKTARQEYLQGLPRYIRQRRSARLRQMPGELQAIAQGVTPELILEKMSALGLTPLTPAKRAATPRD